MDSRQYVARGRREEARLKTDSVKTGKNRRQAMLKKYKQNTIYNHARHGWEELQTMLPHTSIPQNCDSYNRETV